MCSPILRMLCRRVPRGCVRQDCLPLISDLPLGEVVDLAWRTSVYGVDYLKQGT